MQNLNIFNDETQSFQFQDIIQLPEPLSPTYKQEGTSQSLNSMCQLLNAKQDNSSSILELQSTGPSTRAPSDASVEVLSKEEQKRKKEMKNLALWRTQSRFGEFVKGTKILPIKTFLCEQEWLDILSTDEYHTVVDIAEHFEKQGLKIGMILDLNRSTHYYKFDKARGDHPLLADTKYFKFKLEQGAVPTDESIQEVFNMLKQGHESDHITLIHCYNGINRTGYMVCEFLCQYFGLSGEEAAKNFSEARKYKIEHACLVERLLEKYPQSSQE